MKKQTEELEFSADFLDFHSHVLPAIDDGSSDVETSLEMLRLLWSQGVKRVIATPHFDATRLSPNEFLQKIDESEQILRKAMDESGDKEEAFGVQSGRWQGA
jgi:protein-tyrosine phosphatase